MMEASRALGRWRLTGCTVYVTLEPCLMCAGLMVNARIDRWRVRRRRSKGRCGWNAVRREPGDSLNHSFEVEAGVLGDECAAVLREFFRGLRAKRKGAAVGTGAMAVADSFPCEFPRARCSAPALVPAPSRRVILAIDSFKERRRARRSRHRSLKGCLPPTSVWMSCPSPLRMEGEGTMDAVGDARRRGPRGRGDLSRWRPPVLPGRSLPGRLRMPGARIRPRRLPARFTGLHISWSTLMGWGSTADKRASSP